MNQIILNVNKQIFITTVKREFNKTQFDYDYRIDVYNNDFRIRLIGKTITKGAFIHPVLIGRINQLDNGAIFLKYRYNISGIGYIIIISVFSSVLFNYKNIVGLPVAIGVLFAMYYPQYRKLKNEFIRFCHYFPIKSLKD